VRRARVRVNGELTEAFEVEAGVPQGDPLSPLLFNLFIESLSRYLAAAPDLEGVDALGLRVRRQLYADDLAVLEESPEGVQRALVHVHRWCEAWGMEVSTGQGKTEAMCFTRPSETEPPPPPLPPLSVGSKPIHWVEEYRYLGYMLRTDLDDTSSVQKLRQSLLGNYHRYFTRNHVVRASATALQLQLFRTCVLGSINYLRSVISIGAATVRELDTAVGQAVRGILCLPERSAAAQVWIQSRLLTTKGIVARETLRLYLQLETTPFYDGLATRLFHALRREARSAGSVRGRYANWVHTSDSLFSRHARSGVQFDRPTHYYASSLAAHVYGRRVSYVEVRDAMHKALEKGGHPVPAPDAPLPLPPPPMGSLEHTAYLHNHMRGIDLVGTAFGHTPLGVGGPGCSGGGGLPSLDDRCLHRSVASAQLGMEALYRRPFQDGAPKRPYSATAYAERFVRRQCRLCSGSDEDVFHLALACPHPSLGPFRNALLAEARALLRWVWRECEGAASAAAEASGPRLDVAAAPPAPLLSPQQSAALAAALSGALPAGSQQAWFMTYWLLNGTLWSHALASRVPDAPAACALGALFDATNVHHSRLRQLSHRVSEFADTQLRLLALTHAAALSRGPDGPPGP
jgi:Reverse transcriptase (RNA-dependent DNA polymerase)